MSVPPWPRQGVFGAVVEVPLDRLQVWSENPRRITRERLEDLKLALTADPEMLWAKPLLALPDGTVIWGNMRLLAARDLGWTTIPVLRVDLDRERARVWALRDNRAYGEWDEPALAELLAELAAEGIDLALTGFSGKDLDRILAGLVEEKDLDEAPALPAGEPDSQPGQIYELGRHRLRCGDARDPDAIAELTNGVPVSVVLTDPPYGVSYTGKTTAALRIENDDPEGLQTLLGAAFVAADVVLEPSGRFYVFAPAGPLGTEFRLAIRDTGWQLHQTLVWVKNSIVLGHCDYHYQHEDLLYGWKPGPGRPGRGRHAGSRWFGGNAQSSALFFDRPARSSEHPTMKPVGLLAALLQNSSRRGDVVLDPFAGSGSTLIACEQLGRRCLAVELDPRYCDVVRNRYQEIVGG